MRQRPTLEPLEPRLLYSADTPSALAGALVGTPDAEHRLLDAEGELALQSAPQEIVFVDARTPDSAQLIEDIAAQSGRDVEVIVLDAERNGLEQVSEALAGRENVAALHFIGHGGEGVLQLGNTLVSADSLERNPSLVQAWSDVLTADADILLYGCDIAATAQGRLLADTLARLTGADVSASDDATGHSSLGGDWNLEYTTGAIDVAVALSANTQDAWTHLLPSVVLTSYEPSFANMTDNAYEVAGGTTYAQSFVYDSPGTTYTVNQIDLVLYRSTATTGADIDVELRDAPSGGSPLATGSVSRAELGASENWVVVSLNTTATLSDGTTYYIVIKGTGGGGVFLGIDDTDGYAGGNLIIDGTAQAGEDMAFRVVSSDAPVVDLNGNQAGQDEAVTFTEQTPVLIAKNTAAITDPDSTNLASLTATLTARPDGDAVESLSLNAAAAAAASAAGLTVTYTAATGVLLITDTGAPASVATYQTILRGIQYNNTSDAPTTANRVVSVVASDGATSSVTRTSVITVTAVNDAPVNNVPGAQTTDEDMALVFSVADGNAISITDDAGTNAIQVALSGTNGVITLATTTGLTFTVGDGTADGAMTFTGTAAAINAALDGMSFMPNAGFGGAASLSISTDDLGSTGIGGALTDADTVAITVNAVNDAPVASDDSYTVIEDGTLDTDALWFDAAWAYRRALSFDNTAQTENLSDFPVLIALDASRIDYSQTQDSGQDLRFVDGDGTVLAHEIEAWNESGTSYVWVKVPQIDGASGSDFIWMYYGNAAAPDGQSAAAVWSNSYQAVYHLNDNSGPGGPIADSTGVFNGTNSGTTNAGGYIAGARDFNGINQHVNLGANQPFLNNASGATISAWVNADSTSQETLFAVSVGGPLTGLSRLTLDLVADQITLIGRSTDSETGHQLQAAPGLISTGTWHYLTGVIDYAGDRLAIYVDGVQVASAGGVGFASAATPGTDSTRSVMGADESLSVNRYNGRLDEVRLADSAHTADWIAAQYASMTDSFVSYGAEQDSAGVLGNDTDVEGDALSAVLVGGPGNAAFFALNADGSFVYVPTADFYGVDSFTYTANDGTSNSTVATVTITVTPVNDAPIATITATTFTATEQTSLSLIPGGLSVADVDGPSVSLTATLSVGAGVLNVTGGTTGAAVANSGTGTVTISGTQAQINALLAGAGGATLAYFNASDTPSASTMLTLSVSDGTLGASDTATINITAVNDLPVLAGAGGTLAYTEGDAATPIDATLALSDVDDVNIESATVTISAGLVSAEDVLNFTPAFGITGTYTAATGVLALSGSATLAQYEQVLESVTYQNTNTGSPNTGARTVTWVVNDGTDNSVGVTSTITVAPVNDAPVLSAVQLTGSEGGTPVLAPADFSISDPDNGAFTYTVSAVAGGSFEVFNGATWNAAASFTTAQVAAGQVRFVDDGNELAPSFNITANDGTANSATIAGTVSYTPVNDAPVNTVPGPQTGNEDSVLVFSTGNGNAISVADSDAGASPLQVVLTGTNGTISLAGIAGLTFSIGDGVADSTMTFTGTAAAINAALNGLSFTPATNFSGAASLSISTNDQGNAGAGGALSDADAVAITVLPNVAPTVSASGGTTVFTEGSNAASAPVVVDSAVTVSDPDSATLASATISIGAGWQTAEDALGFTGNPATMGNIAGSYNAATGVLSLSSAGATATLAQWQSALRSVVYTNSSDTPSTAARTVSFVVTGQGGTSAATTQQVAVTAMNDAPTLSASGGTTAFTGGGSPVVVDAALALNDVDNATLSGATVWIGGGFQAGQDVLGFGNDPLTMGNITGGYNAASGVLTLSSAGASATLSQWQAALRSVTYGNTSATPIVGMRSVSFDVSDGTAYAVAAASHAVDVSPAPLPPDPGPPPVVPPPVVPPPVVIGPPPVTPPPTPAPQPQPAAAPGRPAVAAGVEETPIQPVSVDIAERPHNPTAAVTMASASDVGTSPALRLAGHGLATSTVEVAGDDLLGEILRQDDTRANGLFQPDEKGRSAGEVVLAEELESLRETLREQDEIQARGTVVLAAGSLSMTLAYLLWLIRGGALVASALSALPAWRILDPLPVLARVPEDEDEEDPEEEDDQTIVSFSDEPVGARQ